MSPDGERRFDEAEIAEIFERAAEAAASAPVEESDPLPARREGLTLAELQEVGKEVGLAPERIAEAAIALAPRGEAERVSSYGHPTSIVRTVKLPRAPSDPEWERLVAEVRADTGTRGRLVSRTGAREWSDGRFHLYIEPSDSGTRLRMVETRAAPIVMPAVGAFAFVDGLILLVTRGLDAATFGPTLEWLLPVLLMLAGGAAVASSIFRAGEWADDREARMDRIAGRARGILAESE